MASKSKARAPRKRSANNPLADLGLFDLPDLNIDDADEDLSDADDSTLENELAALLRGETPITRKNKPAPKVPVDIEKLASECLKDDSDDTDDEDVSTNEELLNELEKLTPDSMVEDDNAPEISPPEKTGEETSSLSILKTLEERKNLYLEAHKAAKLNNDNSKVRRYDRALKTLETLLKTAKTGAEISEEDIPPIVNIPKPSVPASSSYNSTKLDNSNAGQEKSSLINEATIPYKKSSTNDDCDQSPSIFSELINQQNKYKSLALEAKRLGDKELAIKYMKTAKTFGFVIQAAQNNEANAIVLPDPSASPIHSMVISQLNQYQLLASEAETAGNPELGAIYLKTAKIFDAVIQTSQNNAGKAEMNIPPKSPGPSSIVETTGIASQNQAHEQMQTASDLEKAALAAASEEDQHEIFCAPPPPTSILEALQQRLNKYYSTKAAADAENNNAKSRRLTRIIKQYEIAVKDYKAGKEVNFEELPCPPGFGPIPIPMDDKPSTSASNSKPSEPLPSASTKKHAIQTTENKAQIPPVRKPKVQRTNTTSTAEKQLQFLLERQKLFRDAALMAKKDGNIQQAKEYLRMSKGFDSMIQATQMGLPIDVSSIPTPPQLDQSDFVIVNVDYCDENKDLSQAELLENLEKDLQHQIEVCIKNKEHFLRLGDVLSASKFEKLSVESRKDLCVIQHLQTTGDPIPKFHYETRMFSMVVCNTDLSDNELEVVIERGIELPGKPDDLDSYIKIELPLPSSDSPQKAKTHTVRDTNNPVYQEKFKFEINRKSRSQLRIFKRQNLKLELWSRGGFLRSDILLGTCSIKLVDLESKCSIHDSFSVMDGKRKICGSAKLEVEVRIRDPLLVKQVEEVQEKWLVIGNYYKNKLL